MTHTVLATKLEVSINTFTTSRIENIMYSLPFTYSEELVYVFHGLGHLAWSYRGEIRNIY
jgi:hypothetical protein